MTFKSLNDCVRFLENQGELVRVKEEIDPDLEMAEVTRRVFQNEGPALFFENIKASPFPAVSNLLLQVVFYPSLLSRSLPITLQKIMKKRAGKFFQLSLIHLDFFY